MPKKKKSGDSKPSGKTDITSTPSAKKQRAEGIAAATPTSTQKELVRDVARGTPSGRVTFRPPTDEKGQVIPRQSAAQRIFEQEVAAGRAAPSGHIDPSTGKVLSPTPKLPGETDREYFDRIFERTDFGRIPSGGQVDVSAGTVKSAEGQELTPEQAKELAISQGIAKQLEQQEKGAQLFAEQKVAARTPMEIAQSAAAEGGGLTLGREVPQSILPESEGLWTWSRIMGLVGTATKAATLVGGAVAGVGAAATIPAGGVGAVLGLPAAAITFVATLGTEYVNVIREEYTQIRDKSDRARQIVKESMPQLIESANLGGDPAEIYQARAEMIDFLNNRRAELFRITQTAADEDLSNAVDELDEIDKYLQWGLPTHDLKLRLAIENPNRDAAALNLEIREVTPQSLAPEGGISGFFKKLGL